MDFQKKIARNKKQSAFESDMLKLEALLRDVGKLAVDIDRLDTMRREKSGAVHRIAEKNHLSELRGDVEIHAPLKNTVVVVQTKDGSYQIDTRTVAAVVNKIGAEHFFRTEGINPKLTHETVITIAPIAELVKRRNKEAKEWLNQMIEKGIVEKKTIRRITPLGVKRAVKLGKGRIHE